MTDLAYKPTFTEPELALVRTTAERGRVGLDLIGRAFPQMLTALQSVKSGLARSGIDSMSQSFPQVGAALSAINDGINRLSAELSEIASHFEEMRDAVRTCQYAMPLTDAFAESRRSLMAAQNEMNDLRQRLHETHARMVERDTVLGNKSLQLERVEGEVSELRAREQGYRNVLEALKKDVPLARQDLRDMINGVL